MLFLLSIQTAWINGESHTLGRADRIRLVCQTSYTKQTDCLPPKRRACLCCARKLKTQILRDDDLVEPAAGVGSGVAVATVLLVLPHTALGVLLCIDVSLLGSSGVLAQPVTSSIFLPSGVFG